MKWKNWKVYVINIAIAIGVGILSGLLTREGMQVYLQSVIKPAFTPPDWLFPIVWTVLYVLMGISVSRVWLTPESMIRNKGLNLYIVQLVLNFFWSFIFFNAQAFGFATIWLLTLWAVVLLMILLFYKTDKVAAYLQVPYLLWLTLAAYLNISVWILN